ncbi:MAG: hypothetical protein V4527_18260 [Pseudomonadota bacterium]
MAFTYERKIDALGGARGNESEEWHDGYSEAVKLATEIGADADAMIDELIEALDAIVNPSSHSKLSKTLEDAELLLRRIAARVA